jgi:hypothetical protein
VNVVVVVTFRLRSKLRRTAGALAHAVVKTVGAFMPGRDVREPLPFAAGGRARWSLAGAVDRRRNKR